MATFGTDANQARRSQDASEPGAKRSSVLENGSCYLLAAADPGDQLKGDEFIVVRVKVKETDSFQLYAKSYEYFPRDDCMFVAHTRAESVPSTSRCSEPETTRTRMAFQEVSPVDQTAQGFELQDSFIGSDLSPYHPLKPLESADNKEWKWNAQMRKTSSSEQPPLENAMTSWIAVGVPNPMTPHIMLYRLHSPIDESVVLCRRTEDDPQGRELIMRPLHLEDAPRNTTYFTINYGIEAFSGQGEGADGASRKGQ